MYMASLKFAASIAVSLLGTPIQAHAEAVREPILIAVVDTGVAEVGPLVGHVVESYDMVRPERPRTELKSFHGTAVAGVIALNMKRPYGIISMRVDSVGRCSGIDCITKGDAIAASIVKATDLGASVVQVSSAGKMGRRVRQAVLYAISKNVKVVFAAGNDGGLPIALAITKKDETGLEVVGSLDADGGKSKFSCRPRRQDARFSWRPGVSVPTIGLDGLPTTQTGTSFAAPIRAAEIANAM